MSFAPSTDHTPILSLPDEIVASIAEAYVLEVIGDDFSVKFQIAGGLPPQFVLMAVCKRWKSICTSNPWLWTRICIDLLPANPGPSTTATDASIWKRFAVVCGNAFTWGGSLPLDLKLNNWYLSNKSYQTVSQGCDGQVFDSTTLAIKIMRFAIEQCSRWRSFAMQSSDLVRETGTTAGIPWSDLVKVTNRVPKLETLFFNDFWEVHPLYASENRPGKDYMNTFLNAPRLDVATFAAGFTPLNLPWAQLTKIDINTTGFFALQTHVDYFDMVMRHTTAPTVSWGDNLSYFAVNDGDIVPTPLVIENPHIVKLKLPPMILPPALLLPNLTNLEFYISDESDTHVDTVSQIVLLLRDSGCRLLDLTINEWLTVYRGDINSFDPLLPYLDSLQSLTWNALLVDVDSTIDLLRGLRDILGANNPVKLPNLTTLVINFMQSPYERDCIYTGDLNSLEADPVWTIVQTRMLEWPVVKLERFHIIVRTNKGNPMRASSEAFEESEEGKNIKASGVDFELSVPVQSINCCTSVRGFRWTME
ncbi:hypothetical protein CYLTODRAFT_411420 [Cylindrobasidium torrendii FP15055 ss-10]|uniref:F-box domain-containing protein n=1 Tax=Cylindrobasidium torrendii FP15055 ss-10 TaxID=1314674 RepID=A0A0D7B9U3_9AGAR|nr:hypothetical protein CYLTODRAFT_411420 [Cylindrobasidium torrendii FP15055 ss-10]